jgi:flagellar motor switch protein FliM
MIDRMLGGSGRPATVNRALTEIEQNVVDSAVKLLIEGLAEAWKPVTSLSFSIRGRETRPSMLQVAAPNEIVVAVVFDVKVGDARGTINLCLPTTVVEMAGSHFARSWLKQRRELTPAERGWMDENFGRVGVPLVPMIRTQINASSVLALQVGEVVELPVAADHPIDVFANGVKKLTARLVSDEDRLMMIVEERCETSAVIVGGA